METSNQTATQRPEVSLENTPVEVVEEKEKDEGEARDESVPLKDASLNSRSI